MTTSTQILNGDDILRRALSTREKLHQQLTPLTLPYLSAVFFTLFIICACYSEFYSAGVGFNAAFPMKSDGSSLARDLMSLRYPIIFCLLAGDVLLNLMPSRARMVVDRLAHSIGIGAILLLLLGVAAFMFSATFLTLGSSGGQGFASHLVGIALGVASASMFVLSFLSSHSVMGRLFTVIPVIAAGRAARSRIASGDVLTTEFEDRRARIASLQASIAELEKPDALRRKAANEAGVIVGVVASEAHDLVASRKVRGDKAVAPQDHCEVPDVPLDALEQRYADLQPYTSDYFFNILKQKEA